MESIPLRGFFNLLMRHYTTNYKQNCANSLTRHQMDSDRECDLSPLSSSPTNPATTIQSVSISHPHYHHITGSPHYQRPSPLPPTRNLSNFQYSNSWPLLGRCPLSIRQLRRINLLQRLLLSADRWIQIAGVSEPTLANLKEVIGSSAGKWGAGDQYGCW